MTTEAKPPRLLDASEIASLALPDDSMLETPTRMRRLASAENAMSCNCGGLMNVPTTECDVVLMTDTW